MATHRYISTTFWDDDFIQSLDPSEKLVYLYFMTNPLTNLAGVYKITVKRMCYDTGFNADTINHIIAKFEKAGKAYMKGEYIILPSWPKHQSWETKNDIKKGIVSILDKLPTDIMCFLKAVNYRFDLTPWGVEPPLNPPSCPQEPTYSILSYSNLSNSNKEERIPDFEDDIADAFNETVTPPQPSYKKSTLDSRLAILSEAWKRHSELPRYICKLSATMKTNDSMAINAVLQAYTDIEIIAAIDNYAQDLPNVEQKYRVQSFQNFCANSGKIDKYQKGTSIKVSTEHVCPICKGKLKNGQYCKVCEKFFDENGKEMYV